MAEGGKSYSSSDEESLHKAHIEKCGQKLKAIHLSYRGKSKWYGGCRPRKGDAVPTGVEVERLTKSSVLISAITAGDTERSAHLVDSTPLRALNKLTSVSVNDGTFKVTPLLWAVVHARTEVVQLLIEKGVDIDRQGYLENGDIVHTFTPLLRALDNRDRDIVGMLLSHGADPYLRVSGPRISEEEGSTVRYTTWLYPATRAIETDDVDIVSMFMKQYVPLTVYTRNQHTCLCYALNKSKLANRYEIAKCIISFGGRLCSGDGEESGKAKGICFYFKMLIRQAFSLEFTNEKTKFRCNFKPFQVLFLVCQTDYSYMSSPVSKALKQYFGLFYRDRFRNEEYGFTCQKSQECFSYMINYPENAASLKQICRVQVRKSMVSLNPSSCLDLPLPPQLQQYIGLLNIDIPVC